MLSEDEGFAGFARFRATAIGVALVVFAIGMYLRFDYDLPMPPPPPRPASASPQSLRQLDYSANLYRALLEKDAQDLGLPAPGGELEQPFDYDLSEPHRVLSVGGDAEHARDLALALRADVGADLAPQPNRLVTRDLALSLRIDRVTQQLTTGSLTSDHLVLRIENRTDHPLAYRVETRPSVDARFCMDKGDLAHNAIALAGHAVAERTECPSRGGSVTGVTVVRVETIALPLFSYYYVSRLFPAYIGLDARTGRGHVVPKGAICADIPEQAIRRAMEKGETSWRDVIDFYARESCAKYIFPKGYRAFKKPGERNLPVPPE
jgi:hypothetical protein